mgnify:CR=1 FL=1
MEGVLLWGARELPPKLSTYTNKQASTNSTQCSKKCRTVCNDTHTVSRSIVVTGRLNKPHRKAVNISSASGKTH